MKSHKRQLGRFAKKFNQDPDVLLLFLWDVDQKRFDYLKNSNSVVKERDCRYLQENYADIISEEPRIKTKKVVSKKREPNVHCDFTLIGKEVSLIIHLTEEELLKIHEELADDFQSHGDPISPRGVKDQELLNSALFHPQTAYAGKNKYSSIEGAAAALMYSLICNHSFHNGNKRTALVAFLVFLEKHGRCMTCKDNELFKIAVQIADHKICSGQRMPSDVETFYLAKWVHQNSKLQKRDERPISFKKLRQVLNSFGCVYLEGGRIERSIAYTNFLGIKRTKTLSSSVFGNKNINEGVEVSKGLIKTLRDDLHLNAEKGIDSDAFYANAKMTPGDFIVKYKSTLKRLSRL